MTGHNKPLTEFVALTEKSPLSITYHPPAALRTSLHNPRLHSGRQIESLKRSIRAFGFLVPILINSERRILAGHARLQAAVALNLESVPTVSVHNLSPVQARAFMIADNRLADLAKWDKPVLAMCLKDLSEVDINFEIETGFKASEIDLMLHGLESLNEAAQDTDLLSTKNPSVSSVEDLWELGAHRLFCGDPFDASSYGSVMGGSSARMVFADPNGYLPREYKSVSSSARPQSRLSRSTVERHLNDFTHKLCSLLCEHSAYGSKHHVVVDPSKLIDISDAARAVYREIPSICVWLTNSSGHKFLASREYQLLLVFKKGNVEQRENPSASSSAQPVHADNAPVPTLLACRHPRSGACRQSSLPISLLASLMRKATKPGHIVLDPFCLTGTSLIAAEQTGRICHAIEADPSFVDAAIRRWQTFTGAKAIHSVAKKAFADFEKERLGDDQERWHKPRI